MNTLTTGVLTYQPNSFDWNTSIENSKWKCKDDNKYLFDKDSWSIIFKEISLDYDGKLDKLVLEKFYLSKSALWWFC